MHLSCIECGRRIRPRGRTGAYVHASGGAVAACDLDSDHVPQPDWRAATDLRCVRCGAPCGADATNRLRHDDATLDDDHLPDPGGSDPG